MSLVEPRRWTFTLPTPGGDVTCTYHLTPDALHAVRAEIAGSEQAVAGSK